MYKLIVRQLVRRAFRQLSGGDYEGVLTKFGPKTLFVFSGTHAFGGEKRGAEEVRAVFQKMFALFPDLRLDPQEIVVNGWPHDTRVATRFLVGATLADGQPYRNEGMQFLRLRFGRIVEDRLYEDTQKLAAELDRMAQAGRSEALASAA
jgi:ketosteroid isomerase-like protein